MTRSVSSFVTVTLAILVVITIGGAVTAASMPNSGADVTPTVTSSEENESEPNRGAFGTNISVPSAAFDDAEQDFYSSRNALENRSESLIEISESIEADNSYTDENHKRSTENLNELEDELRDFRDAEDNGKNELMAADLSSKEQFLILESIDETSNSTQAEVDAALGEYETAVQAQRTDVRSTLLVYLGSALFVGLLGGAVLGAVVPLVEAKKTAEKMKLSRNVSYKKRAGLAPVGVGLVVLIGAVGLLWYLGAVDLIRVVI